MNFLNILFFAIPEHEYEFIRYRNKLEATAFVPLSEAKIHVKFLKLREEGYEAKDPNPGELFFKGKNTFFCFPLALYLFVRKEKPGTVFIHGFIFPFQLLCLRFFIPSKTKILVQHHAEKPFANPVKKWFQKIAYSKADAYLFSSPGLAEAFTRDNIIRDKTKIHEVMEGSSLFEIRDQKKVKQKLKIAANTVFLWVGRLDENKDPLTVLQAFQKFILQNSNAVLYMIYGTSELEHEVKKFISAHNLSLRIFLVGKIPHEELEDWFNAADYFVAASHYEGSGIALCEAMACGCVPIVTNIPSFESMTDHGKCGYLFERSDVESLYTIFLSLNEADKLFFREKVIEKYHHDLSFRAIGRKILRITQQVSMK